MIINEILSFDVIISLLALIVLEIVLGIDNLVFLSILTEKLPIKERHKARRLGLTFAWVARLILLALAFLLIKFTKPLFSLYELTFSIRDIFLFFGGLFLIGKATQEIHEDLSEDKKKHQKLTVRTTFKTVVIQVAIMDVIFSIDTVLTAIGLTNHFFVMVIAITCAILVMLYAADVTSQFIAKHPTIKMLALCFLILIGMVLVADAFSFHVPRGYVYFAMGFSLSVELLNLSRRKG